MPSDSCEHPEVGYCVECYHDMAERIFEHERKRCAALHHEDGHDIPYDDRVEFKVTYHCGKGARECPTD